MGSHRRKPGRLVRTDLFLADAERINKLLCRYIGEIRVTSPHHAALERVHAELIAAVREITGEDAPWIHRSSTGPAGWLDD
jgi:hypothetical protein